MGDPLLVFDYVGIDTETTGLDSNKDEIVEIAAIEFNESGKTGKVIHKFCRPSSGNIPYEATSIHGITYEMVRDCPRYLHDGVREEIAAFVGDRTVVGHNIDGFDLGFCKFIPKKTYDTLTTCRSKYRSGNKLKSACLRMNIKWDDKQAHGALYDIQKCIELFCKIKIAEAREAAASADNLFTTQIPVNMAGEPLPAQVQSLLDHPAPAEVNQIISSKKDVKLGVIPSADDIRLFETQAYSFSRLNLFNQCKFKWYMQYIKGIKEPDTKDYFQTGKICHKVAEWAAQWCYKKTFSNKLEAYVKVKKMSVMTPETISGLAVVLNKKYEEVVFDDFADYIWKDTHNLKNFFPEAPGLGSFIGIIDKSIATGSYESISKPSEEIYNKMVNDSINLHKCDNPDVIRDCRKILSRFYRLKDFSQIPGDLTITEKKLAFDRDWNSLKDFFDNKTFFRGIIDALSYFKEYVVITDYKTSRKMLTVEQLKEDRQTQIYALLAYKFLPPGSFSKMIIRIEYIRFSQVVEYQIDDPKVVADKALAWINSIIQNVEKEMMRTDGGAFEPVRNEYCGSCHLGDDGLCPLFNKLISGKLDDPLNRTVTTSEDCRAAWKRVETNKAENKHLEKLCKAFISESDDVVKVDKTATLDYYTSKSREYDIEKTLNLLLGPKKINILDIVSHLSISDTELKKLLSWKKLQLSEEEINSISTLKSRTTFGAFTEEEAKAKGYINA